MGPKLTDLTCPDCRGSIWEEPRRLPLPRRPHAVVTLEEGVSLTRRLANHLETAEADRLLGEARQRRAAVEDHQTHPRGPEVVPFN